MYIPYVSFFRIQDFFLFNPAISLWFGLSHHTIPQLVYTAPPYGKHRGLIFHSSYIISGIQNEVYECFLYISESYKTYEDDGTNLYNQSANYSQL